MAFNVKLEVPVFGPRDVETVLQLGAHRIELNAAGSYPQGGLTPSCLELIETMDVVRRVCHPAILEYSTRKVC